MISSTVSKIIDLVNLVYMSVFWWFILEKSGEKGWKALIPIYGNYCKFKSIDNISLFWGYIIYVILNIIIYWSIQVDSSNGIINLGTYEGRSLINLIFDLYFNIRISMNLTKVFNKSGGFTAGLIFLPHIFLGILAFGKSKHKNQMENAEEEANFQEQI